MSRQYKWSALDMALVLELAVQKDGNVQENVLQSLTSLSEKEFRTLDREMPDYLKAMASSPDPVGLTRNVVDNFYGALVHQEDEFKAAEEEVQEPVVEESPLIVDYAPGGKVLYGGIVHHDVQSKGKIYAQGSMDRLQHNS